MALPEVFTALQQGVVDGQENPIGAIINNKFGQVQKYLTITNHAFTSIAVVMSPSAFNALSRARTSSCSSTARGSRCASPRTRSRGREDGRRHAARHGSHRGREGRHAKFQELLKPTYAELAKKFGEAAIARIKDQ